jgi:hypothetical protein
MENEILFIFKNFHKPRTNFKAHNHQYHEIIFFLKGSGQTNVGDESYSYKANDVKLQEAASSVAPAVSAAPAANAAPAVTKRQTSLI